MRDEYFNFEAGTIGPAATAQKGSTNGETRQVQRSLDPLPLSFKQLFVTSMAKGEDETEFVVFCKVLFVSYCTVRLSVFQ